MTDVKTKQCDHCKGIKIIDNFWKCKSTKDGYQLRCKSCHRKMIKMKRDERVRNGEIIPAKRYLQREKYEIIKMYELGMSTREIERKVGISHVSIGAILRKNNIKIRSGYEYLRNSQFKDRHFFDKIDTEEKAYFLGLLYADGCNNIITKSKKQCYELILALQEIDAEIIYKLNSVLMKDEKSITHQTYKNQYILNKKVNKQNQISLRINDKHLCMALLNHGLEPRKSFILKWPNFLDDNLYRHFIRGYIDGDGWISIFRHSKRKSFNLEVGLISSINFCEGAKKYLQSKNFNFSITIIKRYSKPMAKIKCKGKYHSIEFLKWIYEDSNISLKRKYHKFLQSLLLDKSTP